jgi:hypothetical protein
MPTTLTELAALAVAVSLFSTGPAVTFFYDSSAKDLAAHDAASTVPNDVAGAETQTNWKA